MSLLDEDRKTAGEILADPSVRVLWERFHDVEDQISALVLEAVRLEDASFGDEDGLIEAIGRECDRLRGFLGNRAAAIAEATDDSLAIKLKRRGPADLLSPFPRASAPTVEVLEFVKWTCPIHGELARTPLHGGEGRFHCTEDGCDLVVALRRDPHPGFRKAAFDRSPSPLAVAPLPRPVPPPVAPPKKANAASLPKGSDPRVGTCAGCSEIRHLITRQPPRCAKCHDEHVERSLGGGVRGAPPAAPKKVDEKPAPIAKVVHEAPEPAPALAPRVDESEASKDVEGSSGTGTPEEKPVATTIKATDSRKQPTACQRGCGRIFSWLPGRKRHEQICEGEKGEKEKKPVVKKPNRSIALPRASKPAALPKASPKAPPKKPTKAVVQSSRIGNCDECGAKGVELRRKVPKKLCRSCARKADGVAKRYSAAVRSTARALEAPKIDAVEQAPVVATSDLERELGAVRSIATALANLPAVTVRRVVGYALHLSGHSTIRIHE